MNIQEQIQAWSVGSLPVEELRKGLEASEATLISHENQFQYSLEALNGSQREHCRALEEYAFMLLARMNAIIDQTRAALDQGQRGQVFTLGDQLGRAAFQLNQTFMEFKNQALLSAGPTEIPSLNLLYIHKNRLEGFLSRDSQEGFLLALESEIHLACQGLAALESEPRKTDTLSSLQRCFTEHVGHLESMRKTIAELDLRTAPDLFGYMLALNVTYDEIAALSAKVATELKDKGQTPYLLLNHLLTLIDDVSLGNLGDNTLVEALQRLEKSLEELEEDDESAELIEAYSTASDCIYDFLDNRDISGLQRAKAEFQKFGTFLAQVEEDLPDEKPQSFYPSKPLAVTEKTSQLYLSVDEFLVGKSTESRYIQSLDSFQQSLDKSVQKLSPLAGNASPEDQRSYAEFQKAVAAMKVGLDSLRAFLTVRDQNILKQGLLSIEEGTRMLLAL